MLDLRSDLDKKREASLGRPLGADMQIIFVSLGPEGHVGLPSPSGAEWIPASAAWPGATGYVDVVIILLYCYNGIYSYNSIYGVGSPKV